jgi:ABC-2 type transport system permease protein
MRRLVAAELLKVRTTRMWWGLLVGAVLLTVFQALLTAFTAGLQPGPGQPELPPLSEPSMVRSVYGSGFAACYIFTTILGIIGMAGEYRHQTITPTLLAVPRRGRVIAAKLVAYLGLGLLYGLVTTVVAVLCGVAVIAGKDFPLRLGSDDVPQTLVLSVVGVGVWAVLGLGIGTLLRNQVAAILAALGVTLVLDPLVTLGLGALDLGSVASFLPSSASQAVVQGVSTTDTVDLLPWWAGLLVLLGYGVLFAAIGAALTRSRDIT